MASKKSLFRDYKAITGVSRREKVVQFLLWARAKHPDVYVPYPEIVQRINGYPKAPTYNNQEVIAVRNSMSNVRDSLMHPHGFGLSTDPVLGVRATTDDDDLLKKQYIKSCARVRSAQNMLLRTHALIDPKKLSDSPEKTWFVNNAMKVVKVIAASDFSQKLLPPKKKEDK
jgi:hypothetical protein